MSRIIIKNLPKNTSEREIRETFKSSGNITDVKLVIKDGVFRGYSFLGFESAEQAQNAIKTYNNTFQRSLKIVVELAQDFSDPNRQKGWKEHKREWKEVQQKREDDKNLRIKLANLRRANDDTLRTNALLAQYKNDEKFREYLKLTTGSTDALDNVNLKDKKQKEENNNEDKVEEENEVDAASVNNKAVNQDVSDANYWSSLIATGTSKHEEGEPSSPSKNTKKKEWKNLHTVRLRIDRFPKSKNKDKKKKIGLTKQDVKQFFKPLKCKSLRNNTKNRFEFYVGFESESIVKSALRKEGSYILGVRVSLLSLGDTSTTAPPAAGGLQHGKGNAPWAESQTRLMRSEPVAESGKLFIRNLSYLITEEKLKETFSKFGELADVELPVCKQTRKLKGFATVSFLYPSNAVSAMNELDGTELLGRILHVLPSLDDEQIEDQKAWMSSYKKKKDSDQKATAESWHNWNTLFVSGAAVVDIMAKKYNKTKEQILDAEGPQSAAVTLALGETQIVDETRRFLEEHGVSVDAFSDPSVIRSDTVLLVKNLPADTKTTDVAEMFGKWGELGRVVLPPSGTTAIVEYLSSTEAKKALRNMHYRKCGHAPLYLEKAPVKCFTEEFKKPVNKPEEEDGEKKRKRDDGEEEQEDEAESVKKAKPDPEPEAHTTLYVQNLPKDVTEEDIRKHFSTVGEVLSIILAKKGDHFRGYGFVQYLLQKDARSALIKLENSTLGSRNLTLKLSEKKITATVKTARKMQDYGEAKTAKISVKNVPFQATKTELQQLFSAFGGLKRVFLQKHHTGEFNNGGYGFVEYNSIDDAKRALNTLGRSTHLMGRRLVLQWAKEDETVDELRTKTAHQHTMVEAMGGKNKKMRHAIWGAAEKQKDED